MPDDDVICLLLVWRLLLVAVSHAFLHFLRRRFFFQIVSAYLYEHIRVRLRKRKRQPHNVKFVQEFALNSMHEKDAYLLIAVFD